MAFWRGILALRPNLEPLITWNLEDGSVCTIFAQPWFPNSRTHLPQNQEDRRTKVNQLVDEESGNWSVNLISSRFGYVSAMRIVSEIRPPSLDRGSDRLVFTPTTNGQFSVSKAYSSLVEHQVRGQSGNQDVVNQNLTRLWKYIWKQGELPPRIRHFLWKLAHGAIPLTKTMTTRLERGNPMCQLCGQEEEDETHLFFQCPFSRACWFAGSLAIKTESFTSSIQDSLVRLMDIIPGEIWEEAAITLWSVWRCRNDWVFQAKSPSFKSFNHYTSLIRTENMLAGANLLTGAMAGGTVGAHQQVIYTSVMCQVDGSWVSGWRGGTGFVLKRDGELIAYSSSGAYSCCPLQAEATALLREIDKVISMNFPECTFLTDCLTLAEICAAHSPPVDVDWRAYQEVFQVWKKMKMNKGFTCAHMGREHNALADYLAKRGSATGEFLIGSTFPIDPTAPIDYE